MLLALPVLTVMLRLLVILRPTPQTLVLSRVVVGALVQWFDLFVGVCAADIFSGDEAEGDSKLADVEGKTVAAWGAAYALGVLLGGRLLSRTAGLLSGPLGAYAASAVLACLACLATLGMGESLPRSRRVPFSRRESNPLSFLKLFRSGRLVAALATVLALQTLHDGEGDVWMVYSSDVHGWGTRAESFYGAAVGVASTTGGLLTGASVRVLGSRMHTLWGTLSTAVSCVLFSVNSPLAALSVVFSATKDCMSAAVTARLIQAGAAAGLSQGSLAGAVHNLSALVRVFGLFTFGRLLLIGQHYNIPSLPYLLCAASQIAAAMLAVAIPARQWQATRPSPSSGVDATDTQVTTRLA